MTVADVTTRAMTDTYLPRLLPGPGALPPTHADHVARLGRLRPVGPALVEGVHRAGVRGRGGAAFPTGRKMAAVAALAGPTVVVANGTEGEPLSRKDRTLLRTNPHAVIDGIVAAADALGAQRMVLCVKRGQPSLHAGLVAALDDRADARGIELVETPDRYVAGQESALVSWLDGGEARPTSGPRPSVSGVGGRPTLVDNVETLAQVGLVARFGPDWYRSVGTGDEPGSTLVTVDGGVTRPGVHEIPIGLSAASLLDHVGAPQGGAVLVGGYFGGWVDGRRLRATRMSDAGLAALGARLGCGVVAVVPDTSCPLAEVAAVADWYAANSAGQCGACLFGLADIARAVRGLLDGDAGAEGAARRWTAMVRGRGACRLPDGAATFVDSALDLFADEIADHRRGGCGRPYGSHLPTPAGGAWR